MEDLYKWALDNLPVQLVALLHKMIGRLSVLALLFHLHSANSVNVTIPLTAGANTPTVSPSLVSLSIEMDRWPDWVGSTSRNQFFFNTLDNLQQLTGEPPQIRIGGNTEDKASFNANAKASGDDSAEFAEAVFPDPNSVTPYPEASKVLVGNSYYATTRWLPPRTRVTWGLNLGSNNTTTAYLQAQAIANVFKLPEIKNAGIVLDYIEIGNEPDLYKNNGLRPSNYTVNQWVQEWLAFAGNVSSVLGITESSHTKFLGASFAGSSHTTSGFSPQAAFQSGLLTGPGKLISTISQHRYSGSFCAGSGGLLQDLMTKSTIRGNLTVFVPDIQATFAQGRDYILGETNSYACHGAPGVSNTAGAALWALDYALYSTQLKIGTVVFHEGIGFKYDFIQPATLTRSILDASPLPTPLAPHIQPLYYAAIIAAEAIGKSGSAQIAELNINNPRVAGYAVYEHGKVVRAVLINSQAYLSNSPQRNTIHLDLGFAGDGTNRPLFASAKRLAIGHATDDSGVTWGGQTYETPDGRPRGLLNVEKVDITKGLDIQDTEAILLQFL